MTDAGEFKKIDIRSIESIRRNIKEKFENTEPIKAEVDDPPEHKIWNRRILILLKKIGEKSMGYRWMHEREQQYYGQVDYSLWIVQVILTSCLSVVTSGSMISFLSSSQVNDNSRVILAVTLAELILSLLLTVITGVRDISDFKTRSSSHKDTGNKFSLIYHSIQEQFSLEVNDRETDTGFLKDKRREYDDLIQSMPSIRPSIMNQYADVTKDKSICRPLLVSDFENIDFEDEPSHVVNVKTDSSKSKDNKTDRMKYEIERWFHRF